MESSRDRQFAEIGYFLSRRGVNKDPPRELRADSWQAAYSLFYDAFGAGKTKTQFRRSLQNVRDHFDSHHSHSHRRGWHLEDGSPQPLSKLNRDVFNELERVPDDALWRRIKSYLPSKESRRVDAKTAPFFSSEFQGTRASRRVTVDEAQVTHGRVVEALKQHVENTVENAFTYNTQQIDLALKVDGKLRRIYEVKTATDRQSIYTAVGQLCMHSAGASNVEMWIVLPGPIQNGELVKCLQKLCISILSYRLRGKSYRFSTTLAET